MLLDTDIAYKDTLLLHEQVFCADQEFLLLLLHTGILHKKTLFLHEELFCVN